MHKNELFFDLVFLVTPLDPPKFTPSPIPPLEVGSLAIPGYKTMIRLHMNCLAYTEFSRHGKLRIIALIIINI